MRMTESIHWIACGYVGAYFTHAGDCNMYLLKGPEGFVMVDTGGGKEPEHIEKQLMWDGVDPKEIKAILLTHPHGDHAGGLHYWAKRTGAKVYAPEVAAAYLRKGGEYSNERPGRGHIDAFPPDITIADGQEINICGLSFRGIWSPGHCSQALSYLTEIDGLKLLVSGDNFYWGGKVSIFFYPDASREAFRETMLKFDKEDFDAFLPGHRYPVLRGGKEHVKLAIEEIDRQLAGEPAMKG